MVKRYDMREFDHSIERYEDGSLVSYDDYAALAERCERLEGALILGKNGEWDRANDVLEFGSSGGEG